jgi:alcohol dehydrogenase
MKAWKLGRLGGKLSFVDVPVPEVRPGSVLIRVETQSLMSYLKPYVEGKLVAYRAPEDFIPGGNAIGVIEGVGADVWQLKKGQRVVASSHLVARENVQEPGQILIGVTSPDGVGDALQQSWKDGTLSEYALFPAQTVTHIEDLDNYDAVGLTAITRCRCAPCGSMRRSAAGRSRFRSKQSVPARPSANSVKGSSTLPLTARSTLCWSGGWIGGAGLLSIWL